MSFFSLHGVLIWKTCIFNKFYVAGLFINFNFLDCFFFKKKFIKTFVHDPFSWREQGTMQSKSLYAEIQLSVWLCCLINNLLNKI